MSDSDGAVEREDGTLEMPEAPEPTTEAPETEAEDGTAKSLEENLEALGNDLEAAGVDKKEAVGFVAEKLRSTMVKEGLRAVEKMQKEGGKYNKLAALWDMLSPEGRTAYIKDKTSFWNMLKSGATPPTFMLASKVLSGAKVRLLPQAWLRVESFDEKEVKTLLALGALDCPPEMQAAVDHEMSGLLGKLGWALKLLPFVAPEATPELGGAGKVVGWAEKGVKFIEAQLPAVRAEVKKAKIEVKAEVVHEHDQVAGDLNPPVDIKKAA